MINDEKLFEYVDKVNAEEKETWANEFARGLGCEDFEIAQTGGMVMVPYFYLRPDHRFYLAIMPPAQWHGGGLTEISERGGWEALPCYDEFGDNDIEEFMGPERWYTAPEALTPFEAGVNIREQLDFEVPESPELGTLRAGQDIFYSVYPLGHAVPAMASPLGPIALERKGGVPGKWGWDFTGHTALCDWESVYESWVAKD